MGKHRGPRKPQEGMTYAVGYCRPPEHTRFQKGQSRPQQKGRKQKSRTLHGELDDELERKIEVREGGRVRSVTKRRAIAMNLTNKAVMGDQKACATVFSQVRREDLDYNDGHDLNAPLTDNDEALLAEYFRRRQEEERLLKEIDFGSSETRGSDEDQLRPAEAPNQPPAGKRKGRGDAT
jgi:hypothetical protein